ncbi:MAG: nucleotide exchange factor GrpE [Clostridiales bacterium]|nr:nucleotide exchange factor GrpE [Clostridiales bacterium]
MSKEKKDSINEEVEIPITSEEEVKKNDKKEKKQISKLEKKIKELDEKNKESVDSFKRLAAEFDNFRKRTIKEKEQIYTSATNDVIDSFLPVIDNMETANKSVHKSDDIADVLKGFELVYRQFNEVLEKIGVEPIECLDEDFDPELHNAVMHIEDEKYEQNKVIEELQKGYTYKGKVIRHSMVKVAN